MIMKRLLTTALVLLGSVSAAIGDPTPYAADRYSVIWQGASVFVKPSAKELASGGESDWGVVGVFSFGDEEGAIVVNRSDGSIEYLNTESPSPSGMILSQISCMEAGHNPRIEVILDGKLLTLSGSVEGAPMPDNMALKYTPSTVEPPSPSIALIENR